MPRKEKKLVVQIQETKATRQLRNRKSHSFRLERWKNGYPPVYTVRGKRNVRVQELYTPVGIPKEFSFIKNPNGALKVIARLKEYCRLGKSVRINFYGVRELTNDAIILLLSVMDEFTQRHIAVVGTYPNNKVIRSRLEQSGFFSHVYGDVQKSNATTKNTIFTENSNTVSSDLSSNIIESASNTVFGDNRTNEGLQRVLIECMTNTFDHANLKIEGEEHWWLSIEHDDVNKKVAFAFIDNGAGILKSIVRTSDIKGVGLLVQKFLIDGNVNLLRRMLEGKLKKGFKSRTGKPNRGKGIPGIYEAFKRNSFSNLQIITNDIHAKCATDEYIELKQPFVGTFIYLEYDQTNTD